MSLSQARDAVHDAHRALRDGRVPNAYLDPVPDPAAPPPAPPGHAFRQAAKEFLDFKEKEWGSLVAMTCAIMWLPM